MGGAAVDRVVNRLKAVGYILLPSRFAVASVQFAFEAVLQGAQGRAHDLIVVFETGLSEGASVDDASIAQQVEALSHALDVSGSKLVLTAVLVGPPLKPAAMEDISRVARVLAVDEASGTLTAERQIDDDLKVLLPLSLAPEMDRMLDPIAQLRQRLPNGVDAALVDSLLSMSTQGKEAVEAFAQKVLADKLLEPGDSV